MTYGQYTIHVLLMATRCNKQTYKRRIQKNTTRGC